MEPKRHQKEQSDLSQAELAERRLLGGWTVGLEIAGLQMRESDGDHAQLDIRQGRLCKLYLRRSIIFTRKGVRHQRLVWGPRYSSIPNVPRS